MQRGPRMERWRTNMTRTGYREYWAVSREQALEWYDSEEYQELAQILARLLQPTSS